MSVKTSEPAAPAAPEPTLSALTEGQDRLSLAVTKLAEVLQPLTEQVATQDERLERLEQVTAGLVEVIERVGGVVRQIVQTQRL